MNNKGRVLERLQRAFDQRSFDTPMVKFETAFDYLRPDSRLKDLLKRSGLAV